MAASLDSRACSSVASVLPSRSGERCEAQHVSHDFSQKSAPVARLQILAPLRRQSAHCPPLGVHRAPSLRTRVPICQYSVVSTYTLSAVALRGALDQTFRVRATQPLPTSVPMHDGHGRGARPLHAAESACCRSGYRGAYGDAPKKPIGSPPEKIKKQRCEGEDLNLHGSYPASTSS